MSRRMIFVLAISAIAGLCVALMLGERRTLRPKADVAAHSEQADGNPADEMAKAIRKAIEGDRAQ